MAREGLSSSEPRRTYFPALLCSLGIFALTFLAYIPVFRGGLLWDDAAHVTAPALRSWQGLWEIWFKLGATQQYYPVLHSTFWFEYRLWGGNVLGYHLVNIGLHATTACLFAFALGRLRRVGAERRNAFAAEWLAAAVFALHPICVESVAWISEQKNTLSAVFYLLAFLSYLRFDRDRNARWYILGLVFFIVSLLSKSVTATLPAAVLLVIWWRRGRIRPRHDVVPLLPWFVVGMTAGLFTAWIENHYIGAHGAAYELSFPERIFLAGRIVWFYLGKLLYPGNLIFIYPHWQVRIGGAWCLGVIFIFAAVGLLWSVRSRSRAPLTAFLFFIGSLFPALGFFNVYPFIFSYVADHWQYLACLGPIALFVTGGGELAAAWADRQGGSLRMSAHALIVAPSIGLLAVLFGLTFRQAGEYRDGDTLYRATLAKNPTCWMADNNLGLSYLDKGDLENAKDFFRKAIALKPDCADAYNNLGNALAKTPGKLEEAAVQYQKSLNIIPTDGEVLINLGNALAGIGQFPEALKAYNQALQLLPARVDLHINIGSIFAKMGQPDEALREYRLAVQGQPESAEANLYLARALRDVGDGSEALGYYHKALQLNPLSAEAWNSFGATLLRRKSFSEAAAALANAVRLKPTSAVFHNNLGMALLRTGDFNEAAAQFKQAIRILPDFADAHYNLGSVLRQLGSEAEADAEFDLSGRAEK